MKNTSNNFENVIKNLDKYAIITIIIFIIVILVSPYIFTRNWTNINFTDTGNIGSTIGGITAPFIGVLSALLVFLSFRAQINANRYQIQSIETERRKRELDNEITFLYHRLEEIKENGLKQQSKDSLRDINGLLSEMIRTENYSPKKEHDENELINLKTKIQKLESDKMNQLLIVSRQISLYIIVSNKLDEIREEISKTQYEYIESSLRFEYLNSISTYYELYKNQIVRLINKKLLNDKSLLIGIRDNLTKLEIRLNPSA
jgi:hypothetical protein